MGFVFTRIDDRVIHGQLLTRWSKEKKCEGIVAVDDLTAKDLTLCSVLKSAVPETVRTFIFDVETFVKKFPKIQESPRNYFLIVKSPITLRRIIERSIPLTFTDSINVGPMSTRDNSVTIGANASILPQEAEAFDFLEDHGFTVEFRLVPDSSKQLWKQIKQKFQFNTQE